MKGRAALFSSVTGKHSTPTDLYAALDAEFRFTLDPCPMDDGERIMEQDGLARSWSGERVYCNPPYGRHVDRWLEKAKEASLAVYLLPARTDTAWFHDYVLGKRGFRTNHADEVRFVRGRLKFSGAKYNAPFPNVILVYRNPPSSGSRTTGEQK